MDYVMFIDESGNTGNPKLKENGWNWGEQPSFALGSLCIKQKDVEEVRIKITDVLNKYENGLGTARELKSTASYRFTQSLIGDLISVFDSYNAKYYIDITNKRFQVVKYIVEYCVYPLHLEKEFNDLRGRKRAAATILYNNLSDELLSRYIEICEKDYDDSLVKEISEFIDSLVECVNDNEIIECCMQVKNIVVNYSKYNIEIKNLVPIRDITNRNREMSLLPHLDAYLNIIGSTSILRLSSTDKLYIYHDEQKQFSNALIKWTDTMKGYDEISNLRKVQFINSKKDVLIQSIDFLTGHSVKIFNKTTKAKYFTGRDKMLTKTMSSVLLNCNILSTRYEQDNFFDVLKLKSGRTQMPWSM